MTVQMVSKLLGEGTRPGTGQSEVSAPRVTPKMIGVICFHRAQARVSLVSRAQLTCWGAASQWKAGVSSGFPVRSCQQDKARLTAHC